MITRELKSRKVESILCFTISGVSVVGFVMVVGGGIGTTYKVADNAAEVEALAEA